MIKLTDFGRSELVRGLLRVGADRKNAEEFLYFFCRSQLNDFGYCSFENRKLYVFYKVAPTKIWVMVDRPWHVQERATVTAWTEIKNDQINVIKIKTEGRIGPDRDDGGKALAGLLARLLNPPGGDDDDGANGGVGGSSGPKL